MNRFCKNCGKELNPNAAICLNCGIILENNNQTNNKEGNGKRKKGLPTWIIVLIVVTSTILIPIISFAIIGMVAYNTIDSTINNMWTDETFVQEGTIGDTLTTEKLKITLGDVQIHDYITGDGPYDDIPRKGKEYLIFFLDVQNISNYKEYISDLDFTGYADGYEVDVEVLFNDVKGISDLDADLLPGKKNKGYVAFEVDTNWEEFELYYSDWFSDYELIFTIKNNDDLNVEKDNDEEENYNVTGA